MTSDGISKMDWDEIQSLAVSIVNATQLDDDLLTGIRTENLFEALNNLETKYGRLPSILATKADFAADTAQAVALWKEAYSIAVKIGDTKNQLYISSSLARCCLETEDFQDGLRWVEIGEKLLVASPDPGEKSSLLKTREKIQRNLDLLGPLIGDES